MRLPLKTKELVGRLTYADGRGVRATVQFEYDGEDDPYRVGMFITTTDDHTTWEFARDLLDEGVQGPAGLGDVRIWPQPIGGRIFIRIGCKVRGVEDSATLELSLRPVEEFLTKTYARCPRGSEEMDWTETINRILLEA